MFKTIKKIFVWFLMGTVLVSIATRDPTLVLHILGDIFGPVWDIIDLSFHGIFHSTPRIHITK
jgi:hypothetical protein